MKYVDVKEVFQEIPDEITLAISISGCPIKCKGCHSKYLWKDEGKPLTWDSLNALINIHTGITCVCFMGGDQDPATISKLAYHIKKSTDLKVGWYSGRDIPPKELDRQYFDYIKLGPYKEEYGPLNKEGTNQSLLKKVPYLEGFIWEDITTKLQTKEV